MKSYEVIQKAMEEQGVKAVAAALKVSPALVYKWCEPPAEHADPDQSGAKNPLDRVKEIFHKTRDIHLIRWLCNQAGGFYVVNPAPELQKSRDQSIFTETRTMVSEFSDLLHAVTESVDDNSKISLEDADNIRQKWEDLKACVEHFVVGCERGIYAHEAKPRS